MTEKEMLDKLLKNFWWNSSEKHPGFEWSWKEGVTLGEYEPELNTAIYEYIRNRPETFKDTLF